MSTELELKFSMSQAQLSQLEVLLPQLGEVQHSDKTALLNAYFDTADSWFRRHDMGLRSRLKRGQYEQTIKLAGVQHGALQMRPEYNVPCANVTPQLAGFEADIWPPHTDITALQSALVEQFRTDFCRHSWQLKCADGTMVELVYDQGQVRAGDKQQAISELELELLSGNAQQLFNLAQHLLQQLSLRTGWLSKAARGYQLAGLQKLTLPDTVADNVLAQVSALQQAEACYQQQPAPAALLLAARAMSALALALPATQSLQPLKATAATLAQALPKDGNVFASKDYNLWLLAISAYLYHNA
jgi:triphosphatase